MSFETGAYQNAVATLNPAGAPHPAPGDPSFAVRVKPVDAVFTLSLSDSCSIPNHISVQVRFYAVPSFLLFFLPWSCSFLVGRLGSQLGRLCLCLTRCFGSVVSSYVVWYAGLFCPPLVLLVCTLGVCPSVFLCFCSPV